MRLHSKPRRGASAVESAIVTTVTILLLFGLFIGGLGVFRYQQVAHLSREASRWASVHGTQYALDTGKPAATANDVFQQVIAKQATALDLSKLTFSVTWNKNNNPSFTQIINNNPVTVTNTVTVTVTYQWIPEALIGGVTLTSTSVSTMSY